MLIFHKISKLRFVFYFTILAVSISSCISQSTSINKPNIILINIDDMGWKDVGFMGSEYYETPNIDALSAQGMVFTEGYAAASNCAPSRACLMTGQWTPRHGIYTVNSSERGKAKDRKLIPTPNTEILDESHTTIPEVLKKHGYTTCHAGKWHLSHNPLEYGFDKNIGGSHAGMPYSYYPPFKNVNLNGGDDQHLTDLITERTIEFIDTVSAPFFLYFATYAVHTPIQAVKGLDEKYQNKPEFNGQNNAAYASMVENLDRNIGLLISKLQDKGMLENTFIIFTSDNGGLYGITQQKPLRAGKGSYYEGGIREPFFFVFKDKIAANSKSNVPITNLDIFPTILKYAGVENEDLKLDGNDITSVLEGKTDKLERPLFWHFPIYLQAYNKANNENRDSLFRTRPGSVVRYGDWKLHYYFEDKGIELYNISDDIGERKNMAFENPEKTEELLSLLKNWWKETSAPIPTELNPEFKN